jgi:hypothetical protein
MFAMFRRYRRYSISAQAVIRRRDTGSPEGLTTQVNNISQGGMGVYTSVCMEKATPVLVELQFHSFEGIRKDVLEGRIASVSSQGNDYFVGIAFDREISYDRFVEIIG